MCVFQPGCRRSESKTALIISGSIRCSHSFSHRRSSSSPSYSSGKLASRLNRSVNALSSLHTGSSDISRPPESVDAVQCRGAVALRQRGVIEDVMDEEIDVAAVSQHGLPDVDQFRGALADDMDAEEFFGLAVKDQFEEAIQVADDLAARDLLIEGPSDFVRHVRSGQLFFALADRGDLGNREDAVRQDLRQCRFSDLECMAGGESSLLHGAGGETGKPDNIARRINVRHLGLVVLIDLELSGWGIHAEAGC